MSWDPASLLEALDDSASVLTRDGVIVHTNAATERLTGRPRAELIGKRVVDLFPGSAHFEFYRALERVAASGKPEVVDSYYGPWHRWFRSQLYLIGDYVHVLSRDITDQILAEQRLRALSRASQAFAHPLELDHLFEVIAESLAELVGDGCIVRTIADDGEHLRTVAVHHPDPRRRAVLRAFFASPLHVRDGLAARVLATGEPLLLDRIDTQALRSSFEHESHRADIDRGAPHSLIAAALGEGPQRIGVVMMLRDHTPHPYTASDLSLLQDLAERATMALTRARLYEQSQQERQRALAIANASRAFTAAEHDSRAILDLLARVLVAEVGEIAVATLLSEDGTQVHPVAFHTDRAVTEEVQALFATPTPLAGTLSERVVATGQAIRLSNIDVEKFAAGAGERFADAARRFQPRSLMIVPIKRGDRVLGTVSVSRQHSPAPYTDDDERLVAEIADRAVLAFENARILEAERVARQAAQRIAGHTQRLQAIGSQLSHRRPAREIAETILRESIAALGDATGAIWLLDSTGTELEMLASVGYPDPARFARIPLSEEIPLAVAVRAGTPLFIGNAREYTERFPSSAKRIGNAAPAEFAAACLPMFSGGRAIGGLAFAFLHAHPFLPDERTFIEVLASQCAQAIDRSRLLDQERAASAALVETNQTLNAVIHASPAAIIIADITGVIRLWNPAAERMFGWTAAEAIGQLPPAVDDAHRDELRAHLARIASGQTISGFETRRKRRDGSDIDVALWAAPVQRPDGTTQALAVFVDITDRKRAEDLARAADRRKDEFLAMLGHELRNPLAPILTALELMRIRGETAAERERALIERQTRHLVRLVDDLLDISRITRGKIELRKARADLGAVIAQAVEMASPLLEQRNHHLSIAAPRGHVFVDGDEFRLAQVFQNLLTNAAKYTPSGGSITVRMTTQDDFAVAEIEDNGEGISADVLPTIFEPFVQGARKLDRSEGGLGIGLTLVRSLTELHGGSVEAHSEGPGQGSRFTLRLPLAAKDARAPVRPPHRTLPPRTAIRRRILVVDDNRDAAEMLAELLRAAGHEVVVAFDGASALGSALELHPEIALLDIGLPVMDGYDLARRLKAALPASPRLVAITGYGQEHDHRRSQEAGFEAHLVKPVQAARILSVVDDHPR